MIINSKHHWIKYNSEIGNGEIVLEGSNRVIKTKEWKEVDDFREYLITKKNIRQSPIIHFEDGNF